MSHYFLRLVKLEADGRMEVWRGVWRVRGFYTYNLTKSSLRRWRNWCNMHQPSHINMWGGKVEWRV